MASSIAFTDAIGAVTLTNGKPVPGDRFANWTPKSEPIGESANRQSDGALSMFVFRTDFGVTFDLPNIPSLKSTTLVDKADRLCAWLKSGGTCSVTTGDADANVYATCGLMPGTTPTLKLTDTTNLEYTFSVSLINLAGSPVRMVCRYADQ